MCQASAGCRLLGRERQADSQPIIRRLLMRESEWGYLLVYHVFTRWPICQSIAYLKYRNSILGKERVGLLFRDAQALKKKKKKVQHSRVGTTLECTAVQLLSGSKRPHPGVLRSILVGQSSKKSPRGRVFRNLYCVAIFPPSPPNLKL